MKMIENGKHSTRTMPAEELGLDPSNVVKTLNLLNLSPKIQKMIVEGALPAVMTLKRLYGEVPVVQPSRTFAINTRHTCTA